MIHTTFGRGWTNTGRPCRLTHATLRPLQKHTTNRFKVNHTQRRQKSIAQICRYLTSDVHDEEPCSRKVDRNEIPIGSLICNCRADKPGPAKDHQIRHVCCDDYSQAYCSRCLIRLCRQALTLMSCTGCDTSFTGCSCWICSRMRRMYRSAEFCLEMTHAYTCALVLIRTTKMTFILSGGRSEPSTSTTNGLGTRGYRPSTSHAVFQRYAVT